MAEAHIVARENGPYLITGDVRIFDRDAREFALPPGKAIALCRCGNSANKPFCDGSHKRIDFRPEDTAARLDEE